MHCTSTLTIIILLWSGLGVAIPHEAQAPNEIKPMTTIITTRAVNPIYAPGLTFSIAHVEGIAGNFAGEPQGMAYDKVNDLFYGMSNNSGSRQVLKLNAAGSILATSNNQGGSSNNIQDGTVEDGKVYVPRGSGSHLTPASQSGYIQRFDLDLVYETEITLPMSRYATAIAFKHGYWWLACYDHQVYQLSSDLTTVVAIHDVSGGNKPSSIKSYGGMDWYGNYLWGSEHDATEMDIWYWNGTTLTLVQELSTSGLDLDNGLAVHEEAAILYGSSRDLSDDIQKYNIIID